MITTKIFHNTTNQAVNVLGVGEIQAHDHISVTTEYHQPVVLDNYPGVVEVTALSPEEQQAFYEKERAGSDNTNTEATAPEASAQPDNTESAA